jgi:hypothetical protein
MYASGITFTGVQSVSPAPGTLTGANNGLSVSTIDATKDVLGQNVSQAGNPASLLSNREIPAGGFQLNLFNGNFILSNAQQAGAGARMEIYDSITGASARNAVLLQPTFNTSGAPCALRINVINTASNVGSTALLITASAKGILEVFANGGVTYADPVSGTAYAGFEPSFYNNIPLKHPNASNSAFQINALWHPSVAADGVASDIQIGSTTILDNAADIERANILIGGTLSQSGISNGLIRGIFYNPSIAVALAFMNIAWENTSGDVFLCSDPGSLNPGRVGIRTGPAFAGTSPGALLEIGAGDQFPNDAPLKFNQGANLTIPEPGAVEYDGTNFFVTNGTSVRYTLAKTLTATGVLNFPSTAAGTSSDLTIALVGAADGDIVALGVPIAAQNANSCYTAFVSAAGVVTVRFNNYQLLTAIDPASGTFRVSVLKY